MTAVILAHPSSSGGGFNGGGPRHTPSAYPSSERLLTNKPDAPPAATGPGLGHNSEAALAQVQNATVFQQFEAIVDSPDYTSAQKCMLVKIRCRVNAKTMDNAIVGNEGLMRAASLKDPRALRAELRDLQGKAKDLPEKRDEKGRPINDPVDHSRATITVEERPGKASVIGFSPERLHAIVAAYLQYREEKRGPGRPPASGAPPLPGKPPEHDAGGLSGKPPASGTGGLEKPPASHAENPLRQTHPDPFPISGREDSLGAGAPGADATDFFVEGAPDRGGAPPDGVPTSARGSRKPSKADIDTALADYIATAKRCGLPVPRKPEVYLDAVAVRLREGSIGEWREMLAMVERSPHLRGENERRWKADLSWLAERKNYAKVLDGKYLRDKPKPKMPTRY